MAMEILGETIDLHGGGADLIFPHHENEIAQSEAATGKAFVRHWFHVSHLLVENRKMSKSLGNLYTLDDVTSRGWDSSDLRLVLLSGHYRQPLNFSWDTMSAVHHGRERLGRAGEIVFVRLVCHGRIPREGFQTVVKPIVAHNRRAGCNRPG